MNRSQTTELCADHAEQTVPAIRLMGVSKSFRSAGGLLEVLKDVNLVVTPETIVGLIGASGSGKSTLLNIIAGILKADTGQVCICGATTEDFNDWCAVSYIQTWPVSSVRIRV